MKPIASEFNVLIPNHIEIENTLKLSFPGHHISHSGFSDIWRIKNKTYTHSLWLNKHKLSKLITTRNHMITELILINIIVLVLIVLTFLLHSKYDWDLGIYNILIGWLTAGGFANYLLLRIKPQYKKEIQNAHDGVFNALAQLLPEES